MRINVIATVDDHEIGYRAGWQFQMQTDMPIILGFWVEQPFTWQLPDWASYVVLPQEAPPAPLKKPFRGPAVWPATIDLKPLAAGRYLLSIFQDGNYLLHYLGQEAPRG